MITLILTFIFIQYLSIITLLLLEDSLDVHIDERVIKSKEKLYALLIPIYGPVNSLVRAVIKAVRKIEKNLD